MSKDPKLAKKIVALIQEVRKTPFEGRGKPEPLRHELSGCWSRRINKEHRLVYQVTGDEVRILACTNYCSTYINDKSHQVDPGYYSLWVKLNLLSQLYP